MVDDLDDNKRIRKQIDDIDEEVVEKVDIMLSSHSKKISKKIDLDEPRNSCVTLVSIEKVPMNDQKSVLIIVDGFDSEVEKDEKKKTEQECV